MSEQRQPPYPYTIVAIASLAPLLPYTPNPGYGSIFRYTTVAMWLFLIADFKPFHGSITY
jgi:hypothetical protein